MNKMVMAFSVLIPLFAWRESCIWILL